MKYTFLIVVLAVLFIGLGIAVFAKIRLTNDQYDRLKWIVERWHYITTLLGVVVSVINPEYGEETITLVAAIGAFLAGLIGISSVNYNKAKAIEEDGEDEESFVFEDDEDEDDIEYVGSDIEDEIEEDDEDGAIND